MPKRLIEDKKWIFADVDEKTAETIAKKLNISSHVAKAILARCPDNVYAYLDCNKNCFYDPFLLKGMKEAVDRINSAIEKKEKIVVYGDYDVDGITSTYILYDYLRKKDAVAECFIPDRMDEGYGLNKNAISSLKSDGAKLIVTVDLGISAINEAEYCTENGIDLIITDHHSIQGELLPKCISVINPKIESDYPYKNLAGAGVAFKLVCALSKMDEKTIDAYMPYAAIGTITDLVELKDENRYIAKRGLELLKKNATPGLRALFEVSGIDISKVNVANIGFGIGPRLNAAGRISSAIISVNLLNESDYSKAVEASKILDEENKKRKAAEQEILFDALEIIKKDKLDENNVIVVSHPNWHHGVIGIVSSRITDKFYKPSIVISTDEKGVAKASGRSIKGFNLFDALDNMKEMLVKYGGHELAAGLSIKNDMIDIFNTEINKYAKNILTDDILTPSMYIDDVIDIKDISLDMLKQLEMLEPCGMGNRSPAFCIKNLVIQSVKHLENSNHSFITFKDTDGTYIVMPAFNMQNRIKMYCEGNTVDIAGTISLNSYNGKETAQFIIKDLRPSKNKFISRENVGFVYRMVKNSVVNSKFEIKTNEFENRISKLFKTNFGKMKLIICLDVLSDLGMIDYTEKDEKLKITELSGFFKQTSLEKSSVFVKYSIKKGA